MIQTGDVFPLFMRYGFKTLPEARKQYMLSKSLQCLCFKYDKRSAVSIEASELTANMEALSCTLPALLPGTDTENIISYALSLLSIHELIKHYRHSRDITDEMEIRKLYSCFSCAVDPSRNSSCPMLHSIKNGDKPANTGDDEAAAQTCLSDRCRLQLAVLPSYRVVAPKLKKYQQFFIDLQAYRYYPPLTSVGMLKEWSSGYLQRYRDISWWEFCAAADSLFGVLVMYAAAGMPALSAEDAALLDEACFPWLCGLESLLRSVLCMRTHEAEGLNFASFYGNLKECEERIVFFAEKTAQSFSKLRYGDICNNMVKALISQYLTEPEADFGMLKLASSHILKKCSAVRYAEAWKLLRLTGVMKISGASSPARFWPDSALRNGR